MAAALCECDIDVGMDLAALPISQSFERLLTEQLSTVEVTLKAAFQEFLGEHERNLRDEICLLRKESTEMRRRLGTEASRQVYVFTSDYDNNKDEVDSSAKISVVESCRNSHTRSVAESARSSTKNSTSTESVQRVLSVRSAAVKENFKVLPELLREDWVAQRSPRSFRRVSEKRVSEAVDPDSPRFMLDPSSSKRLTWDFLGIPVLAWDLIMLPMQAFDIGRAGENLLFVVGLVTMFYWTFDIPASFCTGFIDTEGRVVKDRFKVVRRYLRGNFVLDLVIVLSDWVEFLGALFEDGLGFLSALSALRFLRIARFMRLLRLRKLNAKMQNFQDLLGNELALIMWHLFVKICALVFINHFIGCGWYFLGSQSFIEDKEYRWVTSVPYPQYDSYGHKLSEANWVYLYLTSLHWAIAQFTPGPQNIQPQNSCERLYTVLVLLFGMVVFSYFVASVTSLRLQMSRMLSKLDRDLWLLRKFASQHRISFGLRQRMMRYIDLVIVPDYHKLHAMDIILIPKLSVNLRAELYNELYHARLTVHPLFDRLQKGRQSVMDDVCSSAIENMSLACGDVAFSSGQVAHFMYVVYAGVLDYLPDSLRLTEEEVCKGRWVSEAVFWTNWSHQGSLNASIESQALLVDSSKLRDIFTKNYTVLVLIRQYAVSYCGKMNEHLRDFGLPSDLQDMFSTDISVSHIMKGWRFKADPERERE